MSRRERRQPIVIERESSSLLWFLLGGALGAGLALLFAPHSGDRTRKLVGRRLGKLRDAAESAFDDLRDAWSPGEADQLEPAEAEDADAAGEPVVESEAADGAEPRPPVRRGAAAARVELEQRLAEARARRQRALAADDEEPVA